MAGAGTEDTGTPQELWCGGRCWEGAEGAQVGPWEEEERPQDRNTMWWMPRTVPGLSSSSPMVRGGFAGSGPSSIPQYPQFQI